MTTSVISSEMKFSSAYATSSANTSKIPMPVGRWGGEEFAISLPNTDGYQATIVAQRIRETLGSLKNKKRSTTYNTHPHSQHGNCSFPHREGQHIKSYRHRRQTSHIGAKKRGRDQIESAPMGWENTPPT